MHRSSSCFIFMMLILIISDYSIQTRQLLLAQATARHGSITPPQFILDTLKGYEGVEPKELTTQGKAQHYYLGKELYRKYWKLLFGGTNNEHIYNQSVVYVKATGTPRGLESAESLVMGLFEFLPAENVANIPNDLLYPPFKDIEQHQSINQLLYSPFGSTFHSIPVHSENGGEDGTIGANPDDEGDFLLKCDDENCPVSDQWGTENMQSDLVKEIEANQNIKETMAKLQTQVKRPVNFLTASYYVHAFVCLRQMNMPYVPIFDDPVAFKYIYFLRTAKFYAKFLLTDVQIRSTTTGILEASLANMDQAINHNGPKLVLYVGHDITIAMLLIAMNYTNLRCVTDYVLYNATNQDTCINQYAEFAASFVFELWKEDNASLTISTRYNGRLLPMPFCHYQLSCPYSHFVSWVNSVKFDDPNSVCGNTIDYSKYYIIIAILSALLLIALAILTFCWCKQKQQVAKQQHYPFAEEIS